MYYSLNKSQITLDSISRCFKVKKKCLNFFTLVFDQTSDTMSYHFCLFISSTASVGSNWVCTCCSMALCVVCDDLYYYSYKTSHGWHSNKTNCPHMATHIYTLWVSTWLIVMSSNLFWSDKFVVCQWLVTLITFNVVVSNSLYTIAELPKILL